MNESTNKAIIDVYLECNQTYKNVDLIQNVFLKVYLLKEDFLIDLVQRKKLKHYIAKMLYNSNIDELRKKSKEVLTESFADTPEVLYNEIDIPLNKLPFLYAEILNMYSQLGTYRAVAKKTNINVSAVYKYVQIAKQEIKKLI